MPWIHLIDENEATSELKEIYEKDNLKIFYN